MTGVLVATSVLVIDTADLLIAATARILDRTVLTRNVAHFPMFPDLSSPY